MGNISVEWPCAPQQVPWADLCTRALVLLHLAYQEPLTHTCPSLCSSVFEEKVPLNAFTSEATYVCLNWRKHLFFFPKHKAKVVDVHFTLLLNTRLCWLYQKYSENNLSFLNVCICIDKHSVLSSFCNQMCKNWLDLETQVPSYDIQQGYSNWASSLLIDSFSLTIL